MRLLIVNTRLDLGGAESSAVNQANVLVEAGYDVHFIAAQGNLHHMLSDQIIYHEFPRFKLINVPKIIKKLVKVYKELRPTIVHLHAATYAPLLKVASGMSGYTCPIVLTYHNTKPRRLPYGISWKILEHSVDHFVAISGAQKDRFQKGGISDSKISVIPNFIDVNHFQKKFNQANRSNLRKLYGISEKDFVIIGVGRLISLKGWVTFLDVIKSLFGTGYENIVGIIVGDGPERGDLESRIEKLPKGCRVKLVGYQSNVAAMLKMADALLFPSESEILPMTLIEASACGMPIVCSDIAGNRSVLVGGETGFLVRQDPLAYSSILREIMRDPPLGKTVGLNAKQYAEENFSATSVVTQLGSMYEALLAAEKSK